MITDKFAIVNDSGSIKYVRVIDDADDNFIDTSKYTILNDNVIQFNDPKLEKLKDYDAVFAYTLYTKSKNSILFG